MAAVTIRDVALAAGVSLSSVSRALNGGKYVSARVAHDVAQAATRLGYKPDFLARSLRTRSSGMVGCLVSDVSNPLNGSIVRAAEAHLRDAGYMLVVASTANDPTRERAAADEFKGRRFDGMLVAPGSGANDSMWRELALGGTPVVVLDRDPIGARDDSRWPAVLVDHHGGAKAATRYLLGLGHRRIALLTADARMRPSRERIAGFQEAYAETGVDPSGAQLCIQSTPMDFAQGDTVALLRGERRPTAIIALGTRILAGVLRAARNLDLSVPRDLSVLSVGDTDLASVHAPAITALRWSLEDVGRAAAELLLQRLRGDFGGGQSRALLEVDLVLRESCAPPLLRSVQL
ncbi:MAG: LacI family transcriptional regulator [Reyranella sp.]|uniref:LacI family DNA-binding transcriptional regulator n=1 Tax=Reyranella sp. TaxID=1929291 RepID=UPI0011FA4C7B|nr:substrate-binding domain-containing protein [Reyranella sp.]TAJ95832.1 MAG: LacI family transcriptional regulator [Reyranella sp.]TBR30052.1 MAG: LacI family transcriptional regulator [Reyranella sp.]